MADNSVIIEVRDPAALAGFFADDPALHIYEIGDLDPFFWPHTRWFGWRVHDQFRAVALLYSGSTVPSLLLLERRDPAAARDLLEALQPSLPARYEAHLSPGLHRCLPAARVGQPGRHLKMSLRSPTRVLEVDTSAVQPLTAADRESLTAFYARSYPGNWFVPRMLETGQYFGVAVDGQLASVAGVHVYSPTTGVAALGNITTDPSHRGHGLARQATARACQSLLGSVHTIGLNVHADNAPAIRCYERLGFEIDAEFEECAVIP